MLDWLYDYGLFFAQVATVVIAIAVVVALIARQKASAQHHGGKLMVLDRGEHFRRRRESLEAARLGPVLGAKARKQWAKLDKRKAKEDKKRTPEGGDSVSWVIDFNGDLRASATPALTEQVSSLLLAAREGDEVVVRLESGGGLVHAYGLAAAQLDRLREAKLKLTICVDKVAASGGYMMACCADRLIAAPFAVVGSIGVVAQVPNVHRLLKKHDIDVEVLTAGKHKRTLTILGENTEEGRAKFVEDLIDTHALFKAYVGARRPGLAIDEVADGDIWYGSEAVERGLIDEVGTSEAYLQRRAEEGKVFELRFKPTRSLAQRLGRQSARAIERGVERAIERLVQLGWERR